MTILEAILSVALVLVSVTMIGAIVRNMRLRFAFKIIEERDAQITDLRAEVAYLKTTKGIKYMPSKLEGLYVDTAPIVWRSLESLKEELSAIHHET